MLSDLNDLTNLLDTVVKTPCHMTRIMDIAKQYKSNLVMSKQISDLITENVYKRKPNEVLSAISVIDTLLREVGQPYTDHITGKIIKLFTNAYKIVDDFKSKNTFYMIRQKWNKIFTNTLLERLDADMFQIDENWPVMSNVIIAPQNKKPFTHKQKKSKQTLASSKDLKCPNTQHESDLPTMEGFCPSRSSNVYIDQITTLPTAIQSENRLTSPTNKSFSQDDLSNPNIDDIHHENTVRHSNAFVHPTTSVPHPFGKPIIPSTNLPPSSGQFLAPSAESSESQSKPKNYLKIQPPLPGNPILSSKVHSSAQCQFGSSSSPQQPVQCGPNPPTNMSMYPQQIRMHPSQMHMSRPNMQMPFQGMPMNPTCMRMPPSHMRMPHPSMRMPPPQMGMPLPQMRMPPSQMRMPHPQMRMPPPQMRMPPPQMRMPPPQMRMPSAHMQMPLLPTNPPISNLCISSQEISSTFTDVNIPENIVKPSANIQAPVDKVIHTTDVSINHPNIQLPDITKPPPDIFIPFPNAHSPHQNMPMQLPDLHMPPTYEPFDDSMDIDACDHDKFEDPSYEPLDTYSPVYNPGVYNPNYEIFAINSRYFETMPQKPEDYSEYQNVDRDRSSTGGDYNFESARYPWESPVRAPKVRKCCNTDTPDFQNVSFLPPLKSLRSNADNENQISLKNYSFCIFMKFNEEEAKKLYNGDPCTICFMRFKSKQSKEFARHMDFHFKIKSDVRLPRTYALNFPNWIENTCKTNDDSKTINETGPPKVSKCRVFDDPLQNKCDVCKEDFDVEWDDEEESYMLQNAVLHEDQPYHPVCVSDIHKN